MLHQGDDVVPIPGSKPVPHLEESVAAVDLELSREDFARIEEAFPKGRPAGDRCADTSTVNH